MRENIKDRLRSKLKSKVAPLPKRKLTEDEENELEELMSVYPEYRSGRERLVKLLQETDNSDLVDAIFEKLEKDFKNGYYQDKQSAVEFIYGLKDTRLLKEFEDYSIGIVSENKKTYDVDQVISNVLFTGDRNLIKKIMAALPPEATSSILTLLGLLSQKFVDIAIEQFSQPQYAGFLPLLTLLTTNGLSEEQYTSIINSVTKEGITEHVLIAPKFLYSSMGYPRIQKFAKKIIEVGWDDLENQSKFMPLNLLVLLLLNSNAGQDKKILLLKNNQEYNYGVDKLQNGYSYFMNAVYYISLTLQLELLAYEVHTDVGKFDIR